MEVYESHLGGIYFDEAILNYDYLYCEQCGDSDTYLGHADTWEEVLPMLMWGWEEDEYKYDQDYIDALEEEFKVIINS
jgi:hypothetical protein